MPMIVDKKKSCTACGHEKLFKNTVKIIAKLNILSKFKSTDYSSVSETSTICGCV